MPTSDDQARTQVWLGLLPDVPALATFSERERRWTTPMLDLLRHERAVCARCQDQFEWTTEEKLRHCRLTVGTPRWMVVKRLWAAGIEGQRQLMGAWAQCDVLRLHLQVHGELPKVFRR